MMKKSGKCILVCAGDLEISGIPAGEDDFIIAVDGGYLYCGVLGLEPDVVIGDFDSLEEKYAEQLEKENTGKTNTEEANTEENNAGSGRRMIRLNPVKDDTDTLAALRFGLKEGYREFHLYGAMGGRLEHTIANMQCLLFLKNEGASGYIWDGGMMMTLIRNEAVSFRPEMEGMLSVFAAEGRAVGVTETGLKYSLDDAVITEAFPVGISNEFTGERAEVSVREGSLYVIVRWE